MKQLTAEQIQGNWNKFLSIIDTHISEPRRSKLKAFYEQYAERIMFMPASHKKEYHNAFPGGYVDHVLRVIECTEKLYESWSEMGADMSGYTIEELRFAAMHHDLGKCGFPGKGREVYQVETSDWHRKNQGKIFKYNPELQYMSVTDRSVFLLNHFGISMSQWEYVGLRLTDGMYEEANKAYYIAYQPERQLRSNIAYILHQADMMAARSEFEIEWLPKLLGPRVEKPTKETNFKLNKNANPVIKQKALKKLSNPGLADLMKNI